MNLPKNKKPVNDYIRYSGLGFQMLAIILLGVFGGYKLDKLIHIRFPVFTLVLSMLSVALAIYYGIKDFLKK
jgi:hypothetical protein